MLPKLDEYREKMEKTADQRRDYYGDEHYQRCSQSIFCDCIPGHPIWNVLIRTLCFLILCGILAGIVWWRIEKKGDDPDGKIWKINEVWKDDDMDSTIKGLLAFVLGFYVFGLLDYRSGVLAGLGGYIWKANRVMMMLEVGNADEATKQQMAKYLLAAYATYWAWHRGAAIGSTKPYPPWREPQVDMTRSQDGEGEQPSAQQRGLEGYDKWGFNFKAPMIEKLYSEWDLLTEKEVAAIQAATRGTYHGAHRLPLTWAQSLAVDQVNNEEVADIVTDIRGLINACQDDIEGAPAYNVPPCFQMMITCIVFMVNLMDSVCTGITVGENAVEKSATTIVLHMIRLTVEVAFYVSLLEFARQVLNSSHGDDYLDADYATYLATFARELQQHYHYDASAIDGKEVE